MKKLLLICGISFLLSAMSCEEEEIIASIKVTPCTEPDARVYVDTELEGSITQFLEIWIINVKNNGKEVRCIPCNLPNDFEVENREIKFDASFLAIPPNVRMIGHPIEIKQIY